MFLFYFLLESTELNLFIVFGKAEYDFRDVSGSLSFQLFADIQHRPAIVLILAISTIL